MSPLGVGDKRSEQGSPKTSRFAAF